jgi:glucose-6-phosphate isomerase
MASPISKIYKKTGNGTTTLTSTNKHYFLILDGEDLNMNESIFLSESAGTFAQVVYVEVVMFIYSSVDPTDICAIKSHLAFMRTAGSVSYLRLAATDANGDLVNSAVANYSPSLFFKNTLLGVGSFDDIGVEVLGESLVDGRIHLYIRNASVTSRDVRYKYYVKAYGSDLEAP